MKRITLAMLIYERDHGTLPPAYTVDANGTLLHSCRVLLLPYLGHEALYSKIRLDEPWDSQHNRQFHDQAFTFYRCPSDPAAHAGQATYSVVIGPDMPFEAGEGKRLADFRPHSDDMILLVERAEPVCWMAPAEIPQSRADEGIQQHGSQYLPAPTAEDIASHEYEYRDAEYEVNARGHRGVRSSRGNGCRRGIFTPKETWGPGHRRRLTVGVHPSFHRTDRRPSRAQVLSSGPRLGPSRHGIHIRRWMALIGFSCRGCAG